MTEEFLGVDLGGYCIFVWPYQEWPGSQSPQCANPASRHLKCIESAAAAPLSCPASLDSVPRLPQQPCHPACDPPSRSYLTIHSLPPHPIPYRRRCSNQPDPRFACYIPHRTCLLSWPDHPPPHLHLDFDHPALARTSLDRPLETFPTFLLRHRSRINTAELLSSTTPRRLPISLCQSVVPPLK